MSCVKWFKPEWDTGFCAVWSLTIPWSSVCRTCQLDNNTALRPPCLMDFLWVCPVIMWPLALCPFCGSLEERSETYRWLHFPSFWKPGEQKWVWQEAKDNERIWGSKEKFWGWGGERGGKENGAKEKVREWKVMNLDCIISFMDRRQPGTETDDCSNIYSGFPNLEISKPACSSSLKHKRLFYFHSMKVSVV